jgi:hypothetical protein
VNRLPPVGLMLFSVGEGGGVLDGVVVMLVEGVVVVDGGAWLPPLPHAAVIAPKAMRAAPPATASMRRPIRVELIVKSPVRVGGLTLLIAVDPRRFSWGGRCDHLG